MERRANITVRGIGALGGFVTVYDFLTTVYGYLVWRHGEIIEVMGLDSRYEGQEVRNNTKLIAMLIFSLEITIATE